MLRIIRGTPEIYGNFSKIILNCNFSFCRRPIHEIRCLACRLLRDNAAQDVVECLRIQVNKQRCV